jgi:hypothetical protein
LNFKCMAQRAAAAASKYSLKLTGYCWHSSFGCYLKWTLKTLFRPQYTLHNFVKGL